MLGDIASCKILVAGTNVEDARLVADILREDFTDVATSHEADQAARDFENLAPRVLVLAFRTLEESERFYLGLHRLSHAVHVIPHRTVVLCSRSESYRAYEACRRHQFDDYAVFWPINYDAQRIRMAVLLAARSTQLVVPSGPTPMQFAVQAQRIAHLEDALRESLSQGDAYLSQFVAGLQRAHERVDAAFEKATTAHAEQPASSGRRAAGGTMTAKAEAPGELDSVFDELRSQLDPVQAWVGSVGHALEPHLESARALASLAQDVKPLVMVVDDDEFQHRFIAHLLSAEAVELQFASSAAALFVALRTARPDLIFMDFHLPDASGVDTMQRLKAVPGTSDIPVILITGTSTRKILMESRQAGAVDFMVKPFDKDRLLRGLRDHLPVFRENEP